jgi:SAM-dependent methyltransferase
MLDAQRIARAYQEPEPTRGYAAPVAEHRVHVAPIPDWVDHVDLERWLGPTAGEPWRVVAGGERDGEARATLTSDQAADLAARLRGIGLDGAAIVCGIEPPLRRPAVRRARTEDARRRRSTTPGFERAGVRLDEPGRWSLTPERLAMRIAGTAAHVPIVDAGCGLGGNAIAFARAGCRVVAIDANADRLELARHNAGIYQVADHIRFIRGDAIALAHDLAQPDAILFVDPPWGTDWNRERCGLEDLPLLAELRPIAARGYAALWAKVPASFATAELPGARPEPLFGEAEGDYRRIKFVLVRLDSAKTSNARG